MEVKLEAASWAGWLSTTPREIKAGARRALRRVGTAVQGTAVELFAERGIGRSIFGKKRSGARKIITRSKLEERDGVMVQPIKLKGLAAIQEKGGRLGPPRKGVIEPASKRALAFPGPGGEKVFALSAAHKGSTHPAIPYAQRAAARHSGALQKELNVELDKLPGWGRRAAGQAGRYAAAFGKGLGL